jgi:hypothetical protein
MQSSTSPPTGLAMIELFGDNTISELSTLTGLDLENATSPADADDEEIA